MTASPLRCRADRSDRSRDPTASAEMVADPGGSERGTSCLIDEARLMSDPERTSPGRWMAVLLSLAGAAACLLPASTAQRFRSGIRDLAAPGQAALAASRDYVTRRWQLEADLRRQGAEARVTELEREVEDLRRSTLIWQTRSATLAADLETARSHDPFPSKIHSTQPLLTADAFQARILAWEGEGPDRWRPVLDQGRDRGLHADELVLATNDPVIDLGTDLQVEPDQPVLAGRCVVGRIGVVGTWTSTIQPLTSLQFRGHAQLLREAEKTAVEGATGVLCGTGTACRLDFVAATEPVRVGDLVVTPLRQSPDAGSFLFGKVTRAELPSGAAHWDIEVVPACPLRKVSEVAVLRITRNTRRPRGVVQAEAQ